MFRQVIRKHPSLEEGIAISVFLAEYGLFSVVLLRVSHYGIRDLMARCARACAHPTPSPRSDWPDHLREKVGFREPDCHSEKER